MKILHIGNTASVPYYLSRGQRKHGHISNVVTFHPSKYNKTPDHTYTPTNIPVIKHILRIIYLLRNLDYDVFHFHERTILFSLDIPLWRFLNKTVVLHRHGTDIRDKPRNPFDQYADLILLSTPDLVKHCPEGYFIPNPIDPEEFTPTEVISHPPIFFHCPSNTTKGTAHINEAIKDELNKTPQGLPRPGFLSLMNDSDIVVDQVNSIGAYGMVAIEGMAMGKAVISSINPDYYPPTCPIIRGTPENLGYVVELIRTRQIDIENRAIRGPGYVDQFHHYEAVAKMVLILIHEAKTRRKENEHQSKKIPKI